MKMFPVIFADNQTKEMVAYIILCCLSLIVLGIDSKSNFVRNMMWCWVFGILGGVIVGLTVKAFGW